MFFLKLILFLFLSSIQTLFLPYVANNIDNNGILKIVFHRFLAQKKAAEMRQQLLEDKRQKAATQIQSFWRMWQARSAFRRCQNAAVIFQKIWRAHKQQKLYKETLRRIVLVQAVVRCHLAVRHFKRMKLAATLIQTQWRGFVARKTYKQKRLAIIKLQSHARR